MNFEKEHIDNELLGKPEGGFTVPDNYFENLEKDVLRKTTGNGFIVPEGYFESLHQDILNKTGKQPKIIRLKVSRRIITGIAASLILLSGLYLLINKTEPVQTPQFSETKLKELSDEDILNYVDVSDIKDAHIVETAFKPEDKMQKQVEDYLINNTEEQLIIEEL